MLDAKDAPGFGASKGVACYVVAEPVELDATVTWTIDLYVVPKYHNTQACLSFQAESKGGYTVLRQILDRHIDGTAGDTDHPLYEDNVLGYITNEQQ